MSRQERDTVPAALLVAIVAITAVVLLGDLPPAVTWPLAGVQSVLVVLFTVSLIRRGRERAR